MKDQMHGSDTGEKPKYETYSWLDEPVDVNKECTMCILHKNGPCSDLANEFFHVLDKQMNVEDEKSREYKKLEREEKKVWARLLDCMKQGENKQLYETRFAEMQAKGKVGQRSHSSSKP